MNIQVYKFNMIRSVGVGFETYDAVIRFYLDVWWWKFGLEVSNRYQKRKE